MEAQLRRMHAKAEAAGREVGQARGPAQKHELHPHSYSDSPWQRKSRKFLYEQGSRSNANDVSERID